MNNDDLPVEPEEQQHKEDWDKARANAAVLFIRWEHWEELRPD